MDIPGAGTGGSFLEQLLRDLMQLMGGGVAGRGPRLDLARTLAVGVATGGEPEGNVEPTERIAFEELARVAELHVAELTGLPVGNAPVEVAAVGPGAWAAQTVEDWRFVLEAASADVPAVAGPAPPRLQPDDAGGAGSDASTPEHRGGSETGPGALGEIAAAMGDLAAGMGDLGDAGAGGPGALLARWMATMGPVLAAMQLGSAIGHLARGALGQYDVPVPRPAGPRLLVVPANVARFAQDWSLPQDQVRLWVCLRELTAHAVLSRPPVAERLRQLVVEAVRGMSEDAAAVVERLEGVDLGNPDALRGLFEEPQAILDVEPSPQRRQAADQLTALTAAVVGYVEHVLDQAGTRLLGGRSALREAWRRRQVDRELPGRAAELLMGMDLSPAQTDRGVAFVRGVVDRAGHEALAALWSSATTLPTPAELEAPGLWLARVGLDD